MDTAELEQFFTSTWAVTVRKFKAPLDLDDLETVETTKKWEPVAEWLIASPHTSIIQIRPALGHLRVFTEYFQEKLAPGLDASYLWGSMACLLQLVSSKFDTLERIPGMIKVLAHKAEAFNCHCAKSFETSNVVKEVCFDMQIQITKFFTESIKHIRAAESGRWTSSIENGAEPQLHIQRQYDAAVVDIGESLSRLNQPRNLRILGEDAPTGEVANRQPMLKERCIMVPTTSRGGTRIFDRLDVFSRLDELLNHHEGDPPLLSVALHGLGGVGKSSIAWSYAETKFSRHVYDVVLWVCGEKDVSMRQSFTNIALRLRLLGAQPQSHDENHVLVHDWFQTTACKWIVIYDNVESAVMLAPYWPQASRQGRAIITTRNRALAFEPATSSIEITPWDAQTGADYLLFLLKRGVGRDMDTENASALTLSEKLSGHALAISQLAGLIHDNEYSIKEFTAMYLQSPGSAHAELAPLWDLAFRSLDRDSFSLLGIISFLMPDSIPPEIFDLEVSCHMPPDLAFLKDKLTGFSAAVRKLTTRSLIKRDKDSGILTVHRLVQTQFRYFLNKEQRQRVFDDTVMLLSHVVPHSDMEKGQLYDEWERYNRYLQHVLNLRDIFEEATRSPSGLRAPQKFCEILKGYQRYFYESCSFEECERTCAVNLVAVSTLPSDQDRIDLTGTIISHQAQVFDALGNPHKALGVCREEIALRLNESPRRHILLAYSTSNLGNIYGSVNDFTEARLCFQKSHEWWVTHFDLKGERRIFAASVLVYEARCMIGLREFAKAEEMLDTTIRQVKEEKPLNFGTLAYAHFCMGTLERSRRRLESAEAHFMEAQNVWLRGDQARLHPFNAGILYKIGACCLDQGKVEASIKHIRDSVEVTGFYSRTMPVEHGRNLFKLSEALLQDGDDSAEEASVLREEAAVFLKKRTPDLVDTGSESAFDDLISIHWK